jgi:multimeric flavodoxin WrbA
MPEDKGTPIEKLTKGMSVEDIKKIRHIDWYNIPILSNNASKKHDKNVEAVKKAIEYHNKKDRKLEVLVIHGSSRSNYETASSKERSNSQMLLQYAIEDLKKDKNINITEINLRDKEVHPCEGCVSTASALCGFPCNCFPLDPMQEYYPLCLKSDVMLFSTPVNQSAMSSRLKLFCDRLISLDGGFLVDTGEWKPKDQEWREKCIEISRSGNIEYAARLANRVCAYFISSKDNNNAADSDYRYGKEVARSLWKGFQDFGCIHTDPYYVVASSDPNEDYSYDKQTLNSNKDVINEAKNLVKNAILLAEKSRKNPPKIEAGRINRT